MADCAKPGESRLLGVKGQRDVGRQAVEGQEEAVLLEKAGLAHFEHRAQAINQALHWRTGVELQTADLHTSAQEHLHFESRRFELCTITEEQPLEVGFRDGGKMAICKVRVCEDVAQMGEYLT